jgi:DNA-binding transcriptional LysR family regulator
MELRHLRYFVIVAEEQNLTRAAARLHISQPPLSRQIRDLENELGVSLFDRGAKSLRLTEVGRLFLVEAHEILQRVDASVDLVKSVALGKRGKVRVGYAAGPTMEILRHTLQIFHDSHPHIKVDLRDMSSLAILRGLRECELDVALSVSLSPRDFDGLVFENLAAYAVKVAFHHKHKFKTASAISLRDIARQPLVTFTREGHPEAHTGLYKLLSPYTSSPNIVGEYDTASSLITAVEAKRGIALVVPTPADLAGNRVALRPIYPVPPLVPIAIVYRKGNNSPSATRFIQAAMAAKAKLTPRSGALLTV